MPDEGLAAGRFPHLNLILRDNRAARLPGGGDTDPRVAANKINRVGHSGRLKKSLDDLLKGYRKRSAERAAAGLPGIGSGIPFAVEIPDGFPLDELVSRFKLEVVAEDEASSAGGTRRYVLVAAERIENSELLQLIEEFAFKIHGSAAVASMLEILDDPEDPRRLDAILSANLRSRWPLPSDEEFLLDVSFQTRGVLADLGERPRKKTSESDEWHTQRLAVWFDTAKSRVYNRWDEFTLKLEDEVSRIVTAHGGVILKQWEDGEWGVTEAKATFPDSVSLRIKMCGRGFTDLVLNHPRVFEVEEPEETEPFEQLAAAEAQGPASFQLLPPAADAPIVCVIDSGIQEGHRLLAAAVATQRSVCLVPGRKPKDIADEVADGGHGTRVSGAVLYPETIPRTGSAEARCWLGNVRVLNEERRLPDTLFPPAMIERVVAHFPDSKIFVQSINTQTPAPTRHVSSWAAKIDELSYKKDLLFIVSAGNLPRRQGVPGKGILDHLADGAEHPDYLLAKSARVATPAQSLQALAVGSIALGSFDDDVWRSIAGHEFPSCFSRSGLGIWDTVKPDVVEFGGDLCVRKDGSLIGAVEKEVTSPQLVRSTLNGGPEVSRDCVGTSFAAPKVAALAADLQRMLPNQPALLYRALIANSARWPEWAEALPIAERINAFRWLGYGRPDPLRALDNDVSRVTLITSEPLLLRAGEAAVFEVPIPESLRAPGEEHLLRIDVTLSYATEPRRTRASLKGYQAVWLDWLSSRLREPLDLFVHRMWKDTPKPASSADPESIDWMLSERGGTGQSRNIRRQGTLQKDWAIVSGFSLPESFAIAVRGHKGWNAADETATARMVLAVSVEALNPEVRVYEPVRVALDNIRPRAEVAIQSQ